MLYALVYLLALLSQVCYVLLALSKDVREAVIINKGIYVGGCFFPLVGMMIVLSICQIKVPKWLNFILILIATAVYALAFTAGYSPVFYKNVEIEERYGITVLIKEYGPLHSLFYVMIGLWWSLHTAGLRSPISQKGILLSRHSCRYSRSSVTLSGAWS